MFIFKKLVLKVELKFVLSLKSTLSPVTDERLRSMMSGIG